MNIDSQRLNMKKASEMKPRLSVNRRNKLEFPLEEAQKRKRSLNFYFQEVQDLLSLIDEEKSIIECKRTDQLTNNYKEKTWKKISHTFNRKNVTKRSDKQLRSKWETLKKIARKEYSSGNLSVLSNHVVQIMLSCNGLEKTCNYDNPIRIKEEPYFFLNERNDNYVPSNRVVENLKENNESGTKYLEEVQLADRRKILSQIVDESSNNQQSEGRLMTRATQYDLLDLNKEKDNRKFSCNVKKHKIRNFQKIFYSEENKRKMEKHVLKMKVLRIELSIRKKLLENLRR